MSPLNFGNTNLGNFGLIVLSPTLGGKSTSLSLSSSLAGGDDGIGLTDPLGLVIRDSALLCSSLVMSLISTSASSILAVILSV